MTEQQKIPDQPDTGVVADAVDDNWVDRWAPRGARPYLRLSRADRPAGTWLLLLPCWWGLSLGVLGDPFGGSLYDLWIAAACAIGAFLMRGAGCTWNDITDRHIDAQVARTRSRPLPSGQVTPKQAAVWMAVQMAVAFGVLLTFNTFAIILAVASLLPVIVYPFAKRFTWWPQVFLGLAFNWGAMVGWAAHTGSLSLTPILLYLAGICWTLFYDTIYALQDIEDDALIGVKSTARLFAENTPRWLVGFQVLALVLLLGAIIHPASPLMFVLSPAALMLVIGGIWAFGVHLLWQLRRLDVDDPVKCQNLFRSNRDAGLILVLFWTLAIFV